MDRTSEHYKHTVKIIWDWFEVADTATARLLYERLEAAGMFRGQGPISRDQFIEKIRTHYPGCHIAYVATVLHTQGWRLDNYVALAIDNGRRMLLTTEQGSLVPCDVAYLYAALDRHAQATVTIGVLLDHLTDDERAIKGAVE